MKIFNFVLESKLDLHYYVKFDGKCDGGGPEPYLDPLMALIDPAPIDIRIKELHGKKILITMCLFWLEARFAFCDLSKIELFPAKT